MSRDAGVILVLALAALTVAGPFAGCTAPLPPPNVADEDPSVRIRGMKVAAERKDRTTLPELVKALDDDDPAVRFFAIEALVTFTGDSFGYSYYVDEEQRKPSLAKWREWLKQQEAASKP